MPARALEIFEDNDFVGGRGKTLFVDDYTPTKVPATQGELWMAFVNQPSKPPFKIGNVVAGQIVQIPLTSDEPVRLYLISHDASGRRVTFGFSNAQTKIFAANKETKIPIITQDGAALNTTINFITSNYSEKTKFRRIQYADDSAFTTNVIESNQGTENAQGLITPNFTITRTGDLTATKSVYVRIGHSSNNINFDRWSLPVLVTFANSGGTGGSSGGTTPGSAAPPSNLALSQASGIVTLTWLNNGGTGNNVIERKIGSGDWAELPAEVASGIATTTDTPTTPGTNIYYYRVKNRSVTGYTLTENISVTVASGGGSAPTDFEAADTEIDDVEIEINLSWTSNSSSGNIILESRMSFDDPYVVLATLPATDEDYQITVYRSSVNQLFQYRLSNSLISEYRTASVFVTRIPPSGGGLEL